MKRKQTNYPSAILTADWHLREDQPPARVDNFWKTQWNKVEQVYNLQKKYNCPVFHSGDLFHHWKPSPFLLSCTIERLPHKFFTVFGNHDLPQHNMDLCHKSGVNTLVKSGAVKLCGSHWGEEPSPDTYEEISERKVLVWHIMTYQGKKLWPGQTDPPATQLLRKYSSYDLIVTGDNHLSFVEQYDGRLLVNPGSLTRQTASQENHRPVVYLWYAENNTVQPVYLKCPQGVISREHIERRNQHDDRIDAFVSRLNTDWEAALNFEENLERFFAENQVKDDVKQIIYKSINL